MVSPCPPFPRATSLSEQQKALIASILGTVVLLKCKCIEHIFQGQIRDQRKSGACINYCTPKHEHLGSLAGRSYIGKGAAALVDELWGSVSVPGIFFDPCPSKGKSRAEVGIVNRKVARRARAGQTFPL